MGDGGRNPCWGRGMGRERQASIWDQKVIVVSACVLQSLTLDFRGRVEESLLILIFNGCMCIPPPHAAVPWQELPCVGLVNRNPLHQLFLCSQASTGFQAWVCGSQHKTGVLPGRSWNTNASKVLRPPSHAHHPGAAHHFPSRDTQTPFGVAMDSRAALC